MNTATLLAFASALFGGALAFTVFWRERRSVAHLSFVAGVAMLAVESIFNGLSLESPSIDEMVYWQHWRLMAMSLLPGIWLFFSLSYGRGNHREFLERWKLTLAAFFLVLPLLGIICIRNLITSASPTKTGHWMLGLGVPGYILNLLFLVGTVLVLMNLERTFRASVGTMRWRIKFMILGLVVLFAVRAYTSTQTLLFHAIDMTLQEVDSGALFV